MTCACAGPGYCRRHRRQMSRRDVELCSGVCPTAPCPDDLRAAYRDLWQRLARERARVPRVLRFLAALWRHARHGFPEAPPAVIAQRQRICKSNVCGKYDAQSNRCTLCGCNVRRRLLPDKTRWAEETCPRAEPLWGPVPGEKLAGRAWRWAISTLRLSWPVW